LWINLAVISFIGANGNWHQCLLNDTVDFIHYAGGGRFPRVSRKPLPSLRSSKGLAASCSRWSHRLWLNVNNLLKINNEE
jgi:hypothetical protein